MKRNLLSGWILFIYLACNSVFAGQVIVKEVALSLYNKPVNGFRLSIDRNIKFVSAQIIKHVGTQGGGNPFEYERTILFENIIYPPVTNSRQISLYFLMNVQSELLTEITVVGMYDYRRSISFREFPELAVKLIADLSELVRKTSGDLLVYDNQVFEPGNLDNLVQKYSNLDNANPDNDSLLMYSQSDGSNNDVYMKADPFAKAEVNPSGKDPDSLLKIISLRRRELELKEKEILRREMELRAEKQDLEINRSALSRQLNQAAAIKDSLAKLNYRLESLEKQLLLGDEVSLSNDSRSILDELNARLIDAETRYAKMKAKKDSLESEIEEIGEKEKNFRNKREILQQKISELESKNNLLKDQIQAGMNVELQSRVQDSVSAHTEKLLMDILVLEDRNDSIIKANQILQSRLVRKESETGTELKSLSDSLSLLKSRLGFYKDEEKKLQELESKLAENESKLRQSQSDLNNSQKNLNEATKELAEAKAFNSESELKLRQALTSLKELTAASQAAVVKLESLQNEIISVRKESALAKEKMNSSQAGQKVLQDSIAIMAQEKKALKEIQAERDKQIALSKTEIDSLQTLVFLGAEKEMKSNLRMDSLESVLDSMKMHAAPMDNQQKFIREQWKKLETWDRELKSREASVSDREKLATQRENFFKKKEEELNNREAAVINLEKKSPTPFNQNQGPGPTVSKTIEVIHGTAVEIEAGQNIPVYTGTAKLTIRQTQTKIVGWFLSQGFFYSENFQDFRFDNLLFYEISTEPFQLVVRTETDERGTTVKLSFRLPGGKFITAGSASATDAAIRQFIEKMLSFEMKN